MERVAFPLNFKAEPRILWVVVREMMVESKRGTGTKEMGNCADIKDHK